MSEFDYTTAAVTVTSHERKSARLEGTYDGLVSFFNLTPDTDSADVTTAARTIVVEGAHHDKTKTGAALTMEDLTGRDPGAGPVRDYWKAARAVRIGLVNAIKRADDSETETTETDYLAKIVKAVESGIEHDVTPAMIKAALDSLLS